GVHTVSATCGGRTITGGRFRVVPPRGGGAALPGTGATPDRRTEGGPERGTGTAPDSSPEADPSRSAAAVAPLPSTGTAVPGHSGAPDPDHAAEAAAGVGADRETSVAVALGGGLTAAAGAYLGYRCVRRRPRHDA
ncbi:hypothetical protein ACTWQE_10495, partial [Streptomyces sp. 8N706]